MKASTLPIEKNSLDKVLKKAQEGQLVFLTKRGQVRFALAAADDFDREVAALRDNPDFVAFLAGCRERARTRPLKTLEEIEEKYGLASGKRKPAKKRKTA
jgi:hypothetical protein